MPGLAAFRFATEAEILEWYGTVPGYLGPIGTQAPVKVVADRTVANMSDFVCGANEDGYHYTGANWGRDMPEPVVADLRNVVEGDASPDGKGVLAIERGIEVGHVFQLGTALFGSDEGAPSSTRTASRRRCRWVATASA